MSSILRDPFAWFSLDDGAALLPPDLSVLPTPPWLNAELTQPCKPRREAEHITVQLRHLEEKKNPQE